MQRNHELSNEISFFVYLLEKYAEYKNTDAQSMLSALDRADMTDYAMKMYPMYHTERIENAFADIDSKAAMRVTL